jgi:hypothetical protein
MEQIEMQHMVSTEIPIPGSTPAVVDRNHLFSLVFDLKRKNESGMQCNPDGQYFTELVSLMNCQIFIYGLLDCYIFTPVPGS